MNNFQKIPFNDIVSFGQQTLLENNLFTVSWILARFCNYNCSYCWPYARSSVIDHQPLDLYLKTIDQIKLQAKNNGFDKFHFSFSGGEPTAYKHFDKIISHYADDNIEYQSLHMTTNLSPSIKWWNRWLKNTETLQRSSITASYHHEFANEDEFGDKCAYLINQGVFVTVNQVMVPEEFDQLYDRCERFLKKGINVTLKPQSDPTASFVVDKYNQDQKNKMQTGFPQMWQNEQVSQVELTDSKNNKYYIDQAERFNAFGFNKFKGWTCNAGYQGIVIRENEIKRSYSCYDQPIGTLTEGFEIFDKPKLCVTPSCVSSADSKIPKRKYVES
jgi:molybdenum cofactor biosynthesis enzyme MoaA